MEFSVVAFSHFIIQFEGMLKREEIKLKENLMLSIGLFVILET